NAVVFSVTSSGVSSFASERTKIRRCHLLDVMKTSHASNLSSGGCRWVGTDLGEGGALVVLRAGGQTVMQDADHAIEQVALGGDVAVTGRLASVVVGAGAG